MKTYSIFIIGIIIGLIFGFVIFASTPIGLRYEYIGLDGLALVRYDRWSGELSLLSGDEVVKYYASSSDSEDWVVVPTTGEEEEENKFQLDPEILALQEEQEQEEFVIDPEILELQKEIEESPSD